LIYFIDVKSTTPAPPPPTKTYEKPHESPSKKNTTVKVEPLHLNVGTDHQQSYQRDEAVNTMDSTFRR
jgi:hypothetical protein